MNRSIALQAGLVLLIGLLLVGFIGPAILVPVLVAAAGLAVIGAAARPVPALVPVRVRRRRG